MNRNILILLLVLAGGHDAMAAPVAPVKSVTAESTAALQAPKPLLIPAAKPAPKPAAKPAAKPGNKAVKPAKTAKSSKPASATKARQASKAKAAGASAKSTKLAPIKLNLSLPPELVEHMELGKPLPESASESRLLPPMFGEEKSAPSPYQLSGKLITNDRPKAEENNYFDTVEGAEFSIEYRH